MSDEALQVRSLVFEVGERAAGAESIPVVVSSDAVVNMPDGPEILLHTADAVDLSRAPLPIVVTHRGNQLNVGVVENIRFERGLMRGDARFGERAEASDYKKDVLSRVIRSVSVFYGRLKSAKRGDGVRVTSRWLPIHVAMVAEPADTAAGFYREAVANAEIACKVNTADTRTSPQEGANMTTATAEATAEKDTQARAAADATARVAAGKELADRDFAVRADEERTRTIRKLGQMNSIGEDTVQAWIGRGWTYEQISDDILAIQKKRGEAGGYSHSALDLTQKDKQRYSLSRAILAASSGDNWKDAGFELECSTEIGKRLNKQVLPGHFLVPEDVQRRQLPVDVNDLARRMGMPWLARDLTTADNSAGGFLVQTSMVGFDEILRNVSVLMRSGATVLPGLRDNVTITRQSATATAEWLATEATGPTESQQTFVQLAMSPKQVAATTDISRKLLMQSSIPVEGMVTSDLAAVCALAGDLAGLQGTGASGQPLGLDNVTGVGTVTGTSLAFDDILEFQTDVAAGNVVPIRGGYVTTHAVASLCIQRVKYASTASPLWEGNVWNGTMQGFPAMASNQVAAAVMYFGDWSKIVIPQWGTLEIDTNPYGTGFGAGIITVRAILSMDVGVRLPIAFSRAGTIT